MLRTSDAYDMCIAYFALRLVVFILMDLNMVAAVNRDAVLVRDDNGLEECSVRHCDWLIR